MPAWLVKHEWFLKVSKCNPNSFGYVICCMHVVYESFHAGEGDVCLRVVAMVVLTSQAMLRKARFFAEVSPVPHCGRSKQKAGPNVLVCLGGRQVRLLDSLTQTPTRAVVSPGRGCSREEHPWNRNDLPWNSEGRRGRPSSSS